MTHLHPNTIEGLIFGLQNFDAVETDLRLTKDEELVVYHDPILEDGRVIRDMTLEQFAKTGFPIFKDIINNNKIINLSTNNKKIFFELKPDCNGSKPIHKEISEKIHQRFVDNIDESHINKGAILILSFQKTLLDPFAREDDFAVYPILPQVNECSNKYVLLKALPKVLRHSLKWHMYDALKQNYKGITFAREFIMGPTSKRHQSYDKLIELMDETGVELGTNLGSIELEGIYPKFHRFSDKTHIHPRLAKKGDGMIVAHRGTGTKGVDLPE